jgi:hypothetical protein
MAHYAHITNGIVDQVIVADQEFIDSGAVGDASEWIQTSYNTRGNVHYAPDSNTPDGGVALRGNYAGIGYTYDPVADAFYAPQPYPSWVLSPLTILWEAPVPYPTDGKLYSWDEATTSWVEVVVVVA